MAALIAGVQYGLSSQGNLNENKSLIFVKLTDSAYRAIEEYIRNKNNCSRAPTIQFKGNEGHLSLPSSQSARGADFNFSLSSNEDIEGPQGSFECIQQVAPRCLESVGALHCKMRVQANDDVYDKTRKKMAEAEEMHKTKCTREIEMEIGRRIKGRGRMPTGGGGNGGASRLLNGFNHHQHQLQSSPPVSLPPSSHNSSSGGGMKPMMPGLGGGGGGGGGGVRGSAKDDITRRPIRDRLIHMLAVRPYKKPELHAAVQREGLREKDRNQLTATLSSIAMQRDNTYYLLRHVWNDVREDWPFYTAQDRQTLKRRKPQNLTPPGSSDGGSSTSSGQSPNSLHPGSPPSVIEAPPANTKRPGYIDGVDGFQTKRQRISRVQNAPLPPHSSSSPSSSAGMGVGLGGRPSSLTMRSTREESNIYNKGGGTGGGGGGLGGGYSSSTGNKYTTSGVTAAVRWTTPSPTPLNNQQPQTNQSANSLSPTSPPVTSSSSFSSSSSPFSPAANGYSSSSLHHHNDHHLNSRQQQQQPEVTATGSSDNTGSSRRGERKQELLSSTTNIATSASSTVDHVVGGSLSVSSLGALSSTSVTSSSSSLSSTSVTSSGGRGGGYSNRDYHNEPKYLIDYPRIESVEDRRRYKADFNTNYMEYRSLHSRVDKVSRKFASLEESLKKEQKDSQAWKTIKNTILEQYQNLKLDKDYQSARQRFTYLHDKLSHIKQRVLEYDTLHCGVGSQPTCL